ncbi:hypothetical protein SCORR_v1c04930 [Spiroplasma corruscae]|uniref:Metallo-beta-lactamase domain-containing protein n=1 Tax=Spiroplasma corruscae TaxID=216934 RepID=A0A222EP23_9MOLU|nr:MBL fold metallo-hydrolase [Spiroplasma corruscae]ASP28265.1 hypothetical protein SCORR_v1c04930 [Spiroplasma corruscae]
MLLYTFQDKNFRKTNGYLLCTEKNNAILIDTGYREYKKILDFTIKKNISIKNIIITHGHFGHFYGLNELSEKHNLPNIYIGYSDLLNLFEPHKNTSMLFEGVEPYSVRPLENLKVVLNDMTIALDGYDLNIFLKKAHTSGSLIIEIDKIKSLFIGDLITKDQDPLIVGAFEKSIEKSDVISALKWFFKSYDNEYRIYPGHGPSNISIHDLIDNDFIIKKYYMKFIDK